MIPILTWILSLINNNNEYLLKLILKLTFTNEYNTINDDNYKINEEI